MSAGVVLSQGFKYAFLPPKIKQEQTEPLPSVFSYEIPLIHAELFSKFVLFPQINAEMWHSEQPRHNYGSWEPSSGCRLQGLMLKPVFPVCSIIQSRK